MLESCNMNTGRVVRGTDHEAVSRITFAYAKDNHRIRFTEFEYGIRVNSWVTVV